jgi:mannan endo-1,4-beta-mannosidase
MKISIAILKFLPLVCLLYLSGCGSDDDSGSGGTAPQETFKVSGDHLIDPCGNTVVLKGINKMSVFDQDDPDGEQYFPEIAKTNANSVRIVWQAVSDNGTATSLTQLENLIKNCIAQKMIPMVEMHEATCDFSQLTKVVSYWTRADVVALVQKYEHALLVNIANEAGDDNVTESQFLSAYKTAITNMRSAGIRPPLVIDATGCGKNLDIFINTAADLMAHDPDHNVMFSVHTYWSKEAIKYVQPTFIKDQLQKAADLDVPFIIGELAAYGGWPGDEEPDYESCSTKGSIDYETLLKEADQHDIGYYVWEWGPGNGYYNYNPPVMCPSLDITSDGTYQSILSIPAGDATKGWIRETILDSDLSIKNTAVKTSYIQKGFTCQ